MTVGFLATFGILPGHIHNNNDPAMTVETFAEIWQRNMHEKFKDSNVLVSCVVHSSKTVYPASLGCPKGGEDTITVTGHFNPKFFPKKQDANAEKQDQNSTKQSEQSLVLKNQTIELCRMVKKELKQSTLSVIFTTIDEFMYVYEKDKE